MGSCSCIFNLFRAYLHIRTLALEKNEKISRGKLFFGIAFAAKADGGVQYKIYTCLWKWPHKIFKMIEMAVSTLKYLKDGVQLPQS